MSVKCVERVLSVLEARVNVCRGESLRRLEFPFSVTYTQKENPLDREKDSEAVLGVCVAPRASADAASAA